MARTKKRKRRGDAALKILPLPRAPSGQLSRSKRRRSIEAEQRAETKSMLERVLEDRARGMGLSVRQASDPISETIAGRMALKGVLTRAQAEAINAYAQLVAAALAAMHAPAGPRCSLNQVRFGERRDDVQDYRRAMRRYNDAFASVRDAGERANRAVNIVVRDLFEPPMSEVSELQRGSRALVKHFGLDRANAA